MGIIKQFKKETEKRESLEKGSGYLLILLVWLGLAIYQREAAGKPFPYPWEALASIFRRNGSQVGMALHTGISMLRWSAGFLIALVSGTLWGILCGVSRIADRLLTPMLTVLQLIPGLAWIPIAMILFGIGNGATIFMIAITVFVPIAINTRGGIRGIDPLILRAVSMMELDRWQVFRCIILPGSALGLVNGLRIGAANGFRVLISAEIVVSSGFGLGYSLFQSRWSLDYASAFGVLIIIALIGLFLEKLIFLPLETSINRRRGYF